MLRALPLLLAAGGCSLLGDDGALERRGPAVAEVIEDLPEVARPEMRMPPPSRGEVMSAYRRIYDALPADVNHTVGRRLADLEMLAGEERDVRGESEPYANAVALYESLLESTVAEDRAEVLYQLARAHDVVGNQPDALHYLERLIREHADSRYVVEAHFRRAEMLFSNESYREAAGDYAAVVEAGAGSPYWRNALYMLGWCRFKNGELEASLDNFFAIVEVLSADAASAHGNELLDDTLRVIVLALSYLDGPETLAAAMAERGKPAWQHRVYARLASDYRDRERFLDSVATLETFIAENALDRHAPVFHQRAIDVLTEGDFPSEIRPRKASFVDNYGIHSEYWRMHDAEVRAEYLPVLKTYLDELARWRHAEAQASGAAADYLAAADGYAQFVATFPDDPATAEHLFLLAECYTEAGDDAQAFPVYRRVAREFPASGNAGEAAYAAVLAAGAAAKSAPSAEADNAAPDWESLEIDAQITFALSFPDDPRAPAVQADAADALFAAGRHREAVDLAAHLVETQPALAAEIERAALLVVGHGSFELTRFAAAETAYRKLLSAAGADAAAGVADAAAQPVVERLLAAIYKQGEVAEQQGRPDEALRHYLRIRREAPDAALAATGLYDAVAVMEEQQRWDEAARLLDAFRRDYPDHALAADAPKRLASLYEKTESWQRAAAEYARIAESGADSEVRRQALYRAAELYLEVRDHANAAASFRAYADRHPEPVALQVEAVHQLDRLAQADGDARERRIWLERKIVLAERLGTAASERLTYLAAEAQYVLAEDARAAFEHVRIEHPLAEALQRKQAALKRAVAGFEAVADYGIAEFVTAATFQIADIYVSLSKAVLESDRPDDLSALELAQYEILLEEQAFPFEEQAIALHEINVRRSWEGTYDEWVRKSFASLRELVPARFDKQEAQVAYVDEIY